MNKAGFELFQMFEQKEWISDDQMGDLGDYIYHCLNTGYRVKKIYGYSNYYSKCQIVLRWKKERGFEERTKLGEAICQNNLVIFFEDEEHTLDKCNCGSAWWGEP